MLALDWLWMNRRFLYFSSVHGERAHITPLCDDISYPAVTRPLFRFRCARADF